jgi:hypothetical protein
VGKTGDQGVDVICYRVDEFGQRLKYIIQCKFYENQVSSPDMQKFLGAITHHRADRGVFVTSSIFTREVEKIANENNITLIDKNRLEDLLKKYDLKGVIKQSNKQQPIRNNASIEDIYNNLHFGDGKDHNFFININPKAILEGVKISLKIGDIKINEVTLLDAQINVNPFSVAKWSFDKTWHDSQGRTRARNAGSGTLLIDENGNVVYDFGDYRPNTNKMHFDMSLMTHNNSHMYDEEISKKYGARVLRVNI